MAQPIVTDAVAQTVAEGRDLAARGEFRAAIDLLSGANRGTYDSRLECALVDLRIDAATGSQQATEQHDRTQIAPQGRADGELASVDAEHLTAEAMRTGLARTGCLWVRGLIPSPWIPRLVSGIDAALANFDAAEAGDVSVDPGWYTPRRVEDRAGPGDALARKFGRQMGSLWTVFSPRMVFELLELVSDIGLDDFMTDFLGERPVLSANKCTLRRVPPEDTMTGWHQDGAFLSDEIGSFNFWITLSDCGRDAPGLDLVPKRMDSVLPRDPDGVFKWSLSDGAVERAAGDTPIVRPEFAAGDALLFDHRLVHRTASSSAMPNERYAIESWFFTPSAYPPSQVPLLI